MLETSINMSIKAETMSKYFGVLVNKIFKILPIIENNESSLSTYMDSLFIEISGCKELITSIQDDPMFITLLGTLTWLMNHYDDKNCTFKQIRREVFHAISICKKLETQVLGGDLGGEYSDGNVGLI